MSEVMGAGVAPAGPADVAIAEVQAGAAVAIAEVQAEAETERAEINAATAAAVLGEEERWRGLRESLESLSAQSAELNSRLSLLLEEQQRQREELTLIQGILAEPEPEPEPSPTPAPSTPTPSEPEPAPAPRQTERQEPAREAPAPAPEKRRRRVLM